MEATEITNETAHMAPTSTEARVRTVLEKVRPYIQSHGGDVWVSGINDGIVTLKIEGTCTHCPLAELTYNRIIKTLLGEEVPEIRSVVLT